MRSTCLVFAIGLAACGNEVTHPGGGGTLELVTSTAGTEPDQDGYTIMVDGAVHGTIGPNDRVAVPGMEAGTHTVELAQIQFNCATLGAFTRAVAVTADGPASVDYDVQCDARSRARIAWRATRSSSARRTAADPRST